MNPTTTTEIGQATSRIMTAVSDAHSSLSGLEEKIDPVLAVTEKEAASVAQQVVSNTQHGSVLNAIGDDIEALVTRLRRIASRVQL